MSVTWLVFSQPPAHTFVQEVLFVAALSLPARSELGELIKASQFSGGRKYADPSTQSIPQEGRSEPYRGCLPAADSSRGHLQCGEPGIFLLCLFESGDRLAARLR